MSATNRAMRIPGGAASNINSAMSGAAGYVLRKGDCDNHPPNTLKDYQRNPELLGYAGGRQLKKIIFMAFARIAELEKQIAK